MKIGILTFHQSVNNGAVMQSYALSRRLREMFPQAVVEIVDYRMARVEEMYAYRLLPFLTTGSLRMRLGRCKLLLQDPGYLRRLRKRTQVFRECLHRLPLSPEMIRDDGMEAVTEYIRQRYDILIVGSDAVWNYVTRGFPNAYLPGPSLDCAKLSYAASCYGMDFFETSGRGTGTDRAVFGRLRLSWCPGQGHRGYGPLERSFSGPGPYL